MTFVDVAPEATTGDTSERARRAVTAAVVTLAVMSSVLTRPDHRSFDTRMLCATAVAVVWAARVAWCHRRTTVAAIGVATVGGWWLGNGWSADLAWLVVVSGVGVAASEFETEHSLGVLAGGVGILTFEIVRLPEQTGWLAWLVGVVMAWSGGALVRRQSRLSGELKLAYASAEEHVAADERRRIAREVHDVLADTLAVTMLRLSTARFVLTSDPMAASAALEEAENLGREAARDLRSVVGLLGATERAPLPTAADIETLVARYPDAEMRIGPSIDLASLPATLGLTLYRITQEALANAARHGEPPTAVSVDAGDGNMRLVVRNRVSGDPSPPDGNGLRGMKERAHAAGGEVTARIVDRDWVVEFCAPLPDE